MKKIGGKWVIPLLVFLFVAWSPAWAGVREDRIARVAAKLEALRNWKLMDVLNLSQDRAERIFMILRPFDKKRETLLRERREVRRKLVRAAEGKAVEDDARSLARRYLAIGTELAKLRERELRALEKELSPQEEAKYLLFVDRFHMEIVRMLTRGGDLRRPKPMRKPGRRGKIKEIVPKE